MKSPFNISDHLYGTIVCIVGVICLSPDSLSLRLVKNLPDVTILIYKFCLYTATSLVIFGCHHRTKSLAVIKALGLYDLIAGILWGLASFFLSFAILKTSAATALVTYSVGPSILTSVFTRIFLKDSIPVRTIIAGVVCFVAIILMFSTEFNSPSNSSAIGGLYAVIAAFSVALYFVFMEYVVRFKSLHLDVFMINASSGFISLIASLCIDSQPVTITAREFLFICLGGVIILPLSLNLIAHGSTFILPAEASMFLLLELVLGPVWVYLAGFEAPPPLALVGGVLVVGSLLVNSALALREEQLRMHSETSSLGATRENNLAWNMEGGGESSGTPFGDETLNAIVLASDAMKCDDIR